jgi:hypothetical protein
VATPEKPKPPAAKPANLGREVRAAALEAAKESVFAKRPYLKLAFANPYNLAIVLGGVAASILTLNPIPAVIALGGEALWLLHAPESKTLRRLLWDPRLDKVRVLVEAQEREDKIRPLPDKEQQRVRELVAREQEINRLASQNPSFTGDLLRTELFKTRKLVDSFVDMALSVYRYERYLAGVDMNLLERDRERWRLKAASEKVPEPEREIAKKNFAVIMKRIEKLREIHDYLGVARAQLDLIENSFQLIADQIVTMQSPAEMAGQLDDLLDGVDSIRQTAVDTEKLLNTMTV